MLKNCYVKTSVVCMLASFLMASVASAIPTNGDFTSGLADWNVEYGTVTDGGGYALFQEDELSLSSTLSRTFNLPVGSLTLSFDVIMNSEAENGVPDFVSCPDAFTASLLDPVTYDPYFNLAPDRTEFYYLDNTGIEETTGIVSIIGNLHTVSLDVSSLAGMDVFLSFDLWGSFDGMLTTVSLDNVNVNVIPAPAALLLGLIGSGLVTWLRRARTI